MARSPLHQAKQIATHGLSFRIAMQRGVFPPRDIANAFFACGYDDLPREEVLQWEPFSLTEDQFQVLVEWWLTKHPGSQVDRLGLRGSDFSKWFSAAAQRRS